MTYAGTDMWFSDIAEAREHWLVKDEDRVPLSDGREIVTIRAEADTGSNYLVVITPLGVVGRMNAGGPVIVTVCQPWQDAWALQTDGPLTASYIGEHLCGGRARIDHLNGGDLAALTLTIAYALDRKPVFD